MVLFVPCTILWMASLVTPQKSQSAVTAAPSVQKKEAASLFLELSVEKTKIKAGDPLMVVTRIRNQGTAPVQLLHWGWRCPTPRVQAEVTDLTTNLPVPHIAMIGCGNTGPVTENDFLTIAPKSSGILREGIVFQEFALTPGKRYRLVLHYKNDPTVPIEPSGYRGIGLWSDTPGLVEKMKTTLACDLTSNAIEITVE